MYSIYLYILHLRPSLYILQWMHGNIYREVFPTFLAKKSYDWWITRRRMEIYTKISKRKDLKWSRQKQRKIHTTHGLCEFGRCCANFAQASHKLKVLCEFRTSLEQLSFEGHIFLISAPNRTRFEEIGRASCRERV